MLLFLLLLACPKPSTEPVAAPPPEAVAPAAPTVPSTVRAPARYTLSGQTFEDPYLWLEDEKAPEVQAWMKAQDDHARHQLGALPERERLAARFKELFYVDSVSAPVKRGTRTFYMRRHADKEKAILYVREGDAPERVLLDPNAWNGGTTALGGWFPSWDGRKLAYKTNPNNGDESWLRVLDVDAGTDLPDVIDGAKYADADWLPDGSGFYYEWLPTDPTIAVDARPGFTEVRFHALGTDPAKDPVVHPRTGNPETFLSSSLSRDGRWHFVYVQHGWSAVDVYVQDRARKGAGFEPVVVGQPHLYFPTVWKDQVYVYTNEGAPKFRVMKTSVNKLGRAHWKELIAEDPAATLDGLSIVGGQLALSYLKDVKSELRMAGLDGKAIRTLPLPSLGAASGLVGLEDDPKAYFSFSSYLSPQQIYEVDVPTGGVSVWARVEVPIDPSPYVVDQVFYPSRDGTKIPMFLVHRKDVPRDGQNPTLLYGYGGFSVSLTPSFRASIYPWLEAGGIYAVANLRGGAEYGEAWHRDGMLDKKQNVFNDFIAAGEYLVEQGYTSPAKLGIMGGSNGGLLVGAAMTQRPDLWGAVVCQVPLLDMLRYQLFGSGRTWIPEYGNPEKSEELAWIRDYSPYQRIVAGTRYPALLMASADHDDRVDPMHARKFVAAIQHASTSGEPALLRIEANAGHGGADLVKSAIESQADTWAFLMAELGTRR